MSLLSKTTGEFLEELASSSPAPGGGTVAAFAGALGASLGSMVCRLTLGKKKYAAIEEDMRKLLEQTEKLRTQLADLMDKDTQAFNLVMDALAMDKETETAKEKRAAAIESATKEATMVPLNVMQCTLQAFDLCREIALKGNTNALSDAGVFALLNQAACRGAYYNVRINLATIKDDVFTAKIRKEADTIAEHVESGCREVQANVESRL